MAVSEVLAVIQCIKVIGGIKEVNGEEYGVYVKRILPGGIAYADGRLQPGDQILEVNGDSLIGVTSERAVDILRTASATSRMRLLIARDDDARCSIDTGIQSISIARSAGLGLTIGGGANRPDGPMVYVQELQPEGDCCRDGRLRMGDQLIAINKDSLVGATHEEARRILAKSKFRHEGITEVAFIPGRGRLHPGLSAHNNTHSSPTKAVGNGLGLGRLKVHVRSPERAAPAAKPKVALDPHIRLKDDKLELMLQYLSLDMSEDKKRQLHQSLTTDSQGTVSYGDFLQALRDLLPEEQEDASLSSSSVLFTQHEVATLLDTSAFHSLTCDSISCNDNEELEQLQLETADLRQEVRRLKSLLKEVESTKKSMEDELQRLNQKALGFLSENRSLQSKLQVAEVSQRQAHSAEQDYEEVIHLLEAEIAELKTQLAGKKAKRASETETDILELKKRLSLLDGQLRKSEVTRKCLEIYNRKLLLFVQNAHKLLSTPCALPEEKRADSQADEDKTGRTTETPLQSPDLAGLLIAEANELLEPSTLSNTPQDALLQDWDGCPAGDGAPDCRDHLHQKTTWPLPPSQSSDDDLQSTSIFQDSSEKPA
ncbi:syntaxin-binding protein 4-like [Varanus komodoensis]|uniref:syntaxin-binding protein 4-like n=1 Tax=Varanus komodoensis TaxID=61221 RepID=UPI001CF76CE3|nr:syntaxin-binding protein 4-like [Varanus komodoensis]